MRTFVLITAILEISAGIAFFLVPHLLPGAEDAGPLAIMWNRMFGAAALAVGYYALLVWKNFGHGPATGFTKVLLVFHIGTAVALFTGYRAGYDIFLAGVALHAVMAALTGFFAMQLQRGE